MSAPSSWGRLFAADMTILQQQDSSFRNQPCEMPIHSTKTAQHLSSLTLARYQLCDLQAGFFSGLLILEISSQPI